LVVVVVVVDVIMSRGVKNTMQMIAQRT